MLSLREHVSIALVWLLTCTSSKSRSKFRYLILTLQISDLISLISDFNYNISPSSSSFNSAFKCVLNSIIAVFLDPAIDLAAVAI